MQVTYPDEFMDLNKDWYVGRLDNRAGGLTIAGSGAHVARKQGEARRFGLYITNSVQEEIACLRGAQRIAERLQPDVAIVTDVTHCTHTPMLNKIEQGDTAAGKGPSVTYGPAVQNNLLQRIIDTADKNKIPFQRQAALPLPRHGHRRVCLLQPRGAKCLDLLPLRHMHTTVEMVHKDDVENCIRLIYETLQNIKPGEDFKYL